MLGNEPPSDDDLDVLRKTLASRREDGFEFRIERMCWDPPPPDADGKYSVDTLVKYGMLMVNEHQAHMVSDLKAMLDEVGALTGMAGKIASVLSAPAIVAAITLLDRPIVWEDWNGNPIE